MCKRLTRISRTVRLSPRKSTGKHCACTSSDSIGSGSDMQLNSVNERLLRWLCWSCSALIWRLVVVAITFRLVAAESLRARGGVQYRFWSTSHGVTIIFWAKSRIRPNWPLSRWRRMVWVRLLFGQFSSTQSWTAARRAASSLGQGKEPEMIWSCN